MVKKSLCVSSLSSVLEAYEETIINNFLGVKATVEWLL